MKPRLGANKNSKFHFKIPGSEVPGIRILNGFKYSPWYRIKIAQHCKIEG